MDTHAFPTRLVLSATPCGVRNVESGRLHPTRNSDIAQRPFSSLVPSRYSKHPTPLRTKTKQGQ